jgi:hypothetical protein
MKSPLRDKDRSFRCTSLLKDLIPTDSRIDSYLMFGGNVELSLAAAKRQVVVHFNRRPLYDFWKCLEIDGALVGEIVRSFTPLPDKTSFYLFQEKWHTYPDPFMRAALLLVLNRHTERGTISHGEFIKSTLNPLTLTYLANLEFTHLELQFEDAEDPLSTILPRDDVPPSVVLLSAGHFHNNYFPDSILRGPEETIIDHLELKKILDRMERPTVLLYHYEPYLLELYQDYTIKLADAHGTLTQNPKFAQEVIVANF